jgi:hypothetical protein
VCEKTKHRAYRAMPPSTVPPAARDVPPSFLRDAVRLVGLRARADANGAYGLVRARRGENLYEVHVGGDVVLARRANLRFLNVARPRVPLFAREVLTPDAEYVACRLGLVLDAAMRAVYLETSTGGCRNDSACATHVRARA